MFGRKKKKRRIKWMRTENGENGKHLTRILRNFIILFQTFIFWYYFYIFYLRHPPFLGIFIQIFRKTLSTLNDNGSTSLYCLFVNNFCRRYRHWGVVCAILSFSDFLMNIMFEPLPLLLIAAYLEPTKLYMLSHFMWISFGSYIGQVPTKLTTTTTTTTTEERVTKTRNQTEREKLKKKKYTEKDRERKKRKRERKKIETGSKKKKNFA